MEDLHRSWEIRIYEKDTAPLVGVREFSVIGNLPLELGARDYRVYKHAAVQPATPASRLKNMVAPGLKPNSPIFLLLSRTLPFWSLKIQRSGSGLPATPAALSAG